MSIRARLLDQLEKRFPGRLALKGQARPEALKARLRQEQRQTPLADARTADPDEFRVDAVDELNRAYAAALRAMVDREFLATAKHMGQRMRAYRVGCHPDVIEFEKRLIRRFAKLGVPLFAHEMLRRPERQDELFVKGVSKARAGQSPHEYGLAVDIVHGVRAWDVGRRSWDVIGHVGKEVALQAGIKMTWGGDWEFYDPAHWQLAGWKTAKAGYPFA